MDEGEVNRKREGMRRIEEEGVRERRGQEVCSGGRGRRMRRTRDRGEGDAGEWWRGVVGEGGDEG